MPHTCYIITPQQSKKCIKLCSRCSANIDTQENSNCSAVMNENNLNHNVMVT